MDIIIVSIIISAAALYCGNTFFQKFTADRSGKNESGCICSSCPGGGCCSAGPAKKGPAKKGPAKNNYEVKNDSV